MSRNRGVAFAMERANALPRPGAFSLLPLVDPCRARHAIAAHDQGD